jgi:glucuronoarabinoxylan endo-1,4-beta-xylanase
MSKKLYFLIPLLSALSLASISYSIPGQIWLDFDKATDVSTEPGWTGFLISNSGTTVNGISIYLTGDIDDQRRGTPSDWGVADEMYRDFIYGISPSGINITLWGLGVGQNCNITLWAFDDNSDPNRIARWYSNGTYIFTTNFRAGEWPWCLENPCYDGPTHAYDAVVTADALGRIKLISIMDPNSATPFAFVNGLRVTPQGTFVPSLYAQSPQPADAAEGVPLDIILRWKAGDGAEKHDVYFGTDQAKVTDANRSNPMGVLVSENQDSNSYDPYGTSGFLKIGTYYYWRIDEVDTTPGPQTITKGEVWSFFTVSNYLVDDFDSYADNIALRSIWKEGSTSAEVSVETAVVSDGKSMRYCYKNNLPPYYSEVYADIADLGMNDPNLPGFGAQALTLYFYGEPTNPIGEQMYVRLTDGDSLPGTATVVYDNMNDTRLKQWNKWSIPLAEFTDVNLANVARITIGFGDGSPGDAGTVYLEDITLHTEVEVLAEVTGEVDIGTVYQELEGFGGAACYDAPTLAYHPNREEVYDLLFRDLGLDALRIKNTYGISSSEIIATGLIASAARQPTRNPNLKLLLVPWSPAAYLKSSGDLGTDNSTLKKDPSDPNNSAPYYYVYKAYADWWLNSLTGSGGFNSVGIYPDYISIQNEPDWGYQDQVCRFRYSESSTYAGYDKAFEAVYNRLDGNVSPMPKMLAPESMGFGGSQTFINALNARGQMNNIYGFSHHLYSDGSYTNPDGMISGMINYHNNYGDYYNKPLFQTEYGQPGDPPTFNDAVLMAQHIYNCLHYERVTSYYQWTSFRNGGYTTGGMINLSPGGGYIIRDLYWFFKAYAYFTDPGWYVINTSLGGTGASNLRMIAFKSPDSNQRTIVILNKSTSNINLTITLNGFSLDNSEIYRSSETEHWAYIGPFYEGGSLMLPARSITTIHSTAFSDCDDVLFAGYGLTSDLSGDCYVNYQDLKIISDNWLNTDCGTYDDCEGADFEPTDGSVNLLDLSRFAEQWLWCNDPADADCTQNWP